jgi:hypothetical protein
MAMAAGEDFSEIDGHRILSIAGKIISVVL